MWLTQIALLPNFRALPARRVLTSFKKGEQGSRKLRTRLEEHFVCIGSIFQVWGDTVGLKRKNSAIHNVGACCCTKIKYVSMFCVIFSSICRPLQDYSVLHSKNFQNNIGIVALL